MKISINGQITTTQCTSLIDVITEFEATPPYAVAVNGEFIPNSEYGKKQLSDDDQIDIVSPIFGG